MYYTNKEIKPVFIDCVNQNKLNDEAVDILVNITSRVGKRYTMILESLLYGFIYLSKYWKNVEIDKHNICLYMIEVYKRGLSHGFNYIERERRNWKRMHFISKDDLYDKFNITNDMSNSIFKLKLHEEDFFYFSYNEVYYNRWKKINTISGNYKLNKMMDLIDYCMNNKISDKDILTLLVNKNKDVKEKMIVSYE